MTSQIQTKPVWSHVLNGASWLCHSQSLHGVSISHSSCNSSKLLVTVLGATVSLCRVINCFEGITKLLVASCCHWNCNVCSSLQQQRTPDLINTPPQAVVSGSNEEFRYGRKGQSGIEKLNQFSVKYCCWIVNLKSDTSLNFYSLIVWTTEGFANAYF